jgi:hypothetical protein
MGRFDIGRKDCTPAGSKFGFFNSGMIYAASYDDGSSPAAHCLSSLVGSRSLAHCKAANGLLQRCRRLKFRRTSSVHCQSQPAEMWADQRQPWSRGTAATLLSKKSWNTAASVASAAGSRPRLSKMVKPDHSTRG